MGYAARTQITCVYNLLGRASVGGCLKCVGLKKPSISAGLFYYE